MYIQSSSESEYNHVERAQLMNFIRTSPEFVKNVGRTIVFGGDMTSMSDIGLTTGHAVGLC